MVRDPQRISNGHINHIARKAAMPTSNLACALTNHALVIGLSAGCSAILDAVRPVAPSTV